MIKPVILVVDDEPELRLTLKILLSDQYDVCLAAEAIEASEIIKRSPVDIVLMDVNMPVISGLRALEIIRQIDDTIGVVMMSGINSARQAVDSLKKGAFDYITKPFDNDDLLMTLSRCVQEQRLNNEVKFLRNELVSCSGYGEILSISTKMHDIFKIVQQVGKTSSSVLITGESGTGKELVARALQSLGDRSAKPIVTVNCGAVPSELMESELFGHEKGSFTGAHARKIGRFEYADGGTIFFDEVSTLPMHLQVKLLRVLQEKTFERVGGNLPIKVDVRVIAASNTDLLAAVKRGTFRDDLYYRLNVVPIKIPPLRERKEDIPVLIAHFIKKHSIACNKSIKGVTSNALEALAEYDWPGNVRELENLIERLVVLARDNHEICYEDVPVSMLIGEPSGLPSDVSVDFRDACRNFERRYIIEVLTKTRWNRLKAACLMKVHRNTLFMKIKELDIKPPKGREQG